MVPFASPPLSRREALRRTALGFGAIGLAGALQSSKLPGAALRSDGPAGGMHFPVRAKRVIYLFMNGGPSHVDTFDPKPRLKDYEGKLPEENTQRKKKGGFVPSPFQFAPRGESGVVMSELFPQLAHCADDLCVIRSMHTDVPNHEPGLLLMNAGHQQPVRPSMGSWISYGLGSENQNLPAFIVLATRRPVVGPALWSNSFLPGAYQGMSVDTSEMDVNKLVTNLHHPTLSRADQRRQLDLLAQLNQLHLEQRDHDAALEAHIRTMETAYRMQAEAAEAFDLNREPEWIRDRYGRTNFGQSCLLARRLCEHGVRFVQVYYL
ncbi:MAG: DUF1501 domain-containing protein, partial [Pirellulaceae bacterium]